MKNCLHKSLAVCIKAAGDPSAEQWAKIRPYMLADVPAEQLYVRTFALAHNAIDRDDEAFDDALLADFARTLPGKGLFIKHPSGWDGDSGPGEGLWFEAELKHMSHDEARTLLRQPDLSWPPGVSTATVLLAGGFMVRTESNKDLLLKTDAGIVRYVSIGFSAKRDEYYRDEAGREMQVRRLTSPGEALEGSLVWLGAQPGARAIKSASRNSEETAMPTQEQLDAANTKAAEFETKYKAAEPANAILSKARAAMGDHAHLLDKPELLAEEVKAAASYRQTLIDDIVAGERAAGLCGDDEEAVTLAKAIYAGTPLPTLEARAEKARAALPNGGRITPTTPGAPESRNDAVDSKGVPAIFAAHVKSV